LNLESLVLQDIWFRYVAEGPELLRGLNLTVSAGESVALTGPSGSGKTTVLRVAAGLEMPHRGVVAICGDHMGPNAEERGDIRARYIGLVFDRPRLLAGLTARENVIAARLPWESGSSLNEESASLLDACGLIGRHGTRPPALSGGERQLVSVARALIGGHLVLLADEPTAHLDRAGGEKVMKVLLERARSMMAATLFTTHDPHVAGMASRTLRLADGAIAAPLDPSRLPRPA
jgi:ABC-type lipoprotein export system ATPase subunit